ncbi:MAG: biliverdin-producing heme oxygenase [Gammaproteobacteria bacterium]
MLGGISSAAAVSVPASLTASPVAEAGCLYVLEGSRLGGRVIARQLTHTLNLSADNGLCFFTGAAAARDDNWKRFCHRIELFCSTPAARQLAVTSASLTFELFSAQLAHE